jgi:DNA repair protein RadC
MQINNWETLFTPGSSLLSNEDLIKFIIQEDDPLVLNTQLQKVQSSVLLKDSLLLKSSSSSFANRILERCKGNLNELGKLSFREVINEAEKKDFKAAVSLVSALELGRRRAMEKPLQKLSISNSEEVGAYLQTKFKDLGYEIFAVLFLNRANQINHLEIVSQGGITGTIADPRIILKKALEHNAISIIICHNHPSGSLKPSRADQEITQKLKKAALFFDISLLDHFIVSEQGYFSFADEGLL